tara:strand:+ start:178 stop:474 length:297 start_codon:yes stop_codon:yes gene_type:complete
LRGLFRAGSSAAAAADPEPDPVAAADEEEEAEVGILSKNAGFSRSASEDITPATPVSATQRAISSYVARPPLAMTGIVTAARILPIASQSTRPMRSYS